MSAPDLHLVTFQDFAHKGYHLAEKIKADTQKQPVDLIICINRGGALLSRILSDYLDVEIAAFGLTSYEGVNQQKELRINQELNKDLKGKVVLLVDDVCDSGKSILKAMEITRLLGPKQILTATLFVKPRAEYKADYWIAETDKWLVFPYEVRETLVALKSVLPTHPETLALLKEYYLSLGIGQVEFNSIERSVLKAAV
jgi:hypoxanthine phosphoribosyltransferase